MVEFDHDDKGQLQAVRGGGSGDSLFAANNKWNKSWDDGSNDNHEIWKLPQEDRGGNHNGNHWRCKSSKESRTDESGKRDNNENRADADTTQQVDDKGLVGVKGMEARDMKKLKKPTKDVWKYGKVDGIRILLAEKKNRNRTSKT